MRAFESTAQSREQAFEGEQIVRCSYSAVSSSFYSEHHGAPFRVWGQGSDMLLGLIFNSEMCWHCFDRDLFITSFKNFPCP